MIMMPLGGMMGPITDDAAVTAAAKRRVYPFFSIAGMSIEPSAEVSATADPLRPANSMLERMLTWASPPRTWPMSAWLSRTRFTVICPAFIISPARMKNGIAISGKLSIPLYMRPMSRVKNWVLSSIMRLIDGATSSANMTGSPHSISSRKTQKKARDIDGAYGTLPVSSPASGRCAGTDAGSASPLTARRMFSTLTAASRENPVGTIR